MDEKLKEIFSKNLRRLLSEHDKTQADLCRYLSISSATASDWANAKKIPRADKLQRICMWLNCELSDLLTEQADVPTGGQPTEYYEDATVAKVADALRTNPESRVVFDAMSDMTPEDMKVIAKLIKTYSD